MNLNVTQENLYLFLAGKISLVANFMMHDENLTPVQAIEKFYASETYQELETEETKLWHLGPAPLYQEYLAHA